MGGGDKKAEADIGLIKSFVGAARQAAKECGLQDDLTLSHIIRIPDAIIVQEEAQDEEALTKIMQSALDDALDMLTDMRQREGEHLKQRT